MHNSIYKIYLMTIQHSQRQHLLQQLQQLQLQLLLQLQHRLHPLYHLRLLVL